MSKPKDLKVGDRFDWVEDLGYTLKVVCIADGNVIFIGEKTQSVFHCKVDYDNELVIHKPKTLRPLNAEDVIELLCRSNPMERAVREKETSVVQLISGVDTDTDEVYLSSDCWVASDTLLDAYVFVRADKTTAPCGVEE